MISRTKVTISASAVIVVGVWYKEGLLLLLNIIPERCDESFIVKLSMVLLFEWMRFGLNALGV